jgi:hypothetical protein
LRNEAFTVSRFNDFILLSKNILENLDGKLLMKNDYEFQIKLTTIAITPNSICSHSSIS